MSRYTRNQLIFWFVLVAIAVVVWFATQPR